MFNCTRAVYRLGEGYRSRKKRTRQEMINNTTPPHCVATESEVVQNDHQNLAKRTRFAFPEKCNYYGKSRFAVML